MQVFSACGCQIVGGHTSEGTETSLGFSITGIVDENRVLRKTGLQPGQALILTKGLGTGAIMAGHMRLKTKGRYVYSIICNLNFNNSFAGFVVTEHDSSILVCSTITVLTKNSPRPTGSKQSVPECSSTGILHDAGGQKNPIIQAPAMAVYDNRMVPTRNTAMDSYQPQPFQEISHLGVHHCIHMMRW